MAKHTRRDVDATRSMYQKSLVTMKECRRYFSPTHAYIQVAARRRHYKYYNHVRAVFDTARDEEVYPRLDGDMVTTMHHGFFMYHTMGQLRAWWCARDAIREQAWRQVAAARGLPDEVMDYIGTFFRG